MLVKEAASLQISTDVFEGMKLPPQPNPMADGFSINLLGPAVLALYVAALYRMLKFAYRS